MAPGVRQARLAAATLLAVTLTACSTQTPVDPVGDVIPPAQPVEAATGPGTYVGEAVNELGVPVDVRVVIPADTAVAPTPQVEAAAGFLRQAATQLRLPPPTLRYVTVTVDNTGELDAVPLPDNIDVLDQAGRGANFRPLHELVGRMVDLMPRDTEAGRAAAQAGTALEQQLLVRDDRVRPGQSETVVYAGEDALVDVGTVIVDGSLAVKEQ